MFRNVHNPSGSTPQARNAAARRRTVFIALVLALTIGNSGHALAQGSGKVTHTRLDIGNTPRKICLYEIFEVMVQVVRGVEDPDGNYSLFPRPKIDITARSMDPNVVSLLGESDLAPLTGGTIFKFRGDKAGPATLVFNAVVTLVRGELAIGSKLAEPNKAEEEKFLEVVECSFEVETVSQFSAQGVKLAATMEGELKSDEQGNLTGSGTVNWVGGLTIGYRDCTGAISLASSQAELTGNMNDSGQLAAEMTYLPAALTHEIDCAGTQTIVAEVIPDPLVATLASTGGVLTQAQDLFEPSYYSMHGNAVIVVIPKEEGAAALSPKLQAALSPWLFIASVGPVLASTFKSRGKNPQKKSLSKRRPLVLLILLPLLVLSACGSGAGGQPLEPEADIVYGPGDFIFPETNAGLADLSSYKATLLLSFDGTRGGQVEHRTETYVMLSTKEPAARHLLIVSAGAVPVLEPVFLGEMDGAAYEQRGERTCSATVIDPGNSMIDGLAPAGLLTPVIGAEDAGSETINDVASDHYTFDERAFGLLGQASSTGEMWVASEGGYIVRYLVTIEGDAAYFGEGVEGTLSWDYQLTDVNVPAAIELPAGCPAGMVDAPLLPDAANVVDMPSVLGYDTSSSAEEAATFYQEQLPTLGWQPLGEPAIAETTALLDFTKGDQTMTVIISAGDSATTITIIIAGTQ